MLANCCYHAIVKEPKYAEPLLQRFGGSPIYYLLFERR